MVATGSQHFNELRRGVPRMSPTLLSKRLHQLVRAGIADRRTDGAVEVDGPDALRRAVPRWFTLSAFASVPRPAARAPQERARLLLAGEPSPG